MARSTTLVLGAGFGGLSVAEVLRERLGGEHEVVLVDRAERFSMGLRKLWELVGHGTIAEGSRPRERAVRPGVRFVRGAVEAVDLERRAARVDGRELRGDRLVVALGAEPRPDLVPGLGEHGHDVWSADRVPAARDALARLEGGRVVIAIAGAPYPCPPAPYECALLVDEHLRARGIRERTELVVTTLQPLLLPNAGREGSAWIGERLAERGIEWRTGAPVERVEPGRLVLADGELPFDLLIGVPPHRPPAVVAACGLVGESGWATADPRTFATPFPGVWAIGDVTLVRLANGLPLPKAGLMAELEARAAATAIAAELGAGEPEPFDGAGHCFLELGTGTAALVRGAFYAEPEPAVELAGPSPEHAAAKRAFERERLARWFGG